MEEKYYKISESELLELLFDIYEIAEYVLNEDYEEVSE